MVQLGKRVAVKAAIAPEGYAQALLRMGVEEFERAGIAIGDRILRAACTEHESTSRQRAGCHATTRPHARASRFAHAPNPVRFMPRHYARGLKPAQCLQKVAEKRLSPHDIAQGPGCKSERECATDTGIVPVKVRLAHQRTARIHREGEIGEVHRHRLGELDGAFATADHAAQLPLAEALLLQQKLLGQRKRLVDADAARTEGADVIAEEMTARRIMQIDRVRIREHELHMAQALRSPGGWRTEIDLPLRITW